MRTPMSLAVLLAVTVGCFPDQIIDPGATLEPHSGFFVSVDGSATADGSSSSPWALATALGHPGVVQPGDTIWLRGGTYRGEFTSTLTGTPTAPIVLRQFPGERATIDGRLNVNGRYTYYWGFEVMYSDPKRITAIAGSDPDDLPRQHMTIFVVGAFNKLINLVVHDLGDGVFAGSAAEGLEIHSSLFYNNGWVGPDRAHGHNVYLQNRNATKVVTDNVLFNSFGDGLHIYGSSAAYLQNFHIEGNAIFNSGEAAAPGSAAYAIEHWGGAIGSLGATIYRENSIYRRDGSGMVIRLNAAGAPPGEDMEFSGNIVHGQTHFSEMKRYIISRNKFSSGGFPLSGQNVLIGLRIPSGVPYSAHTWNGNQYAAPPTSTQYPFHLVNGTGVVYRFPEWKSTTGYDGAGSFLDGDLSGADIVVRPNRYEQGRGLIICWNWSAAGQVAVDLSSILRVGENFEIHHVFDVFGPALFSGTYTGGSVSIPQPTLSPPAPIGHSQASPMPNNRFNVFLVRKR
jgi:hypothetical protein